VPQEHKGNLLAIIVLGSAYFVAAKLTLPLASVHPSATPVWPCTGLALAALLLLGYNVWPGIFAGAFFANLTTAGSVATSIGIATGNTLEGLIGAYLVVRFAGGRNAFDLTENVFRFSLLAGMFSAVSASFGVTSLALGGYASWSKFGIIWITWWLGDVVGAIVVAPLLILWIAQPRLRWRSSRLFEGFALFTLLLLISQVVFGGWLVSGTKNYPLEYLCIPVLLWAAFRFGQREASVATFVLAELAMLGTLHGFGPFARDGQNESLLLLQSFIGVVSVMILSLATVFAERRRSEEQAQSLAVSDPLTGLGNYRKLVETLLGEIKRSDRTGRPFAVLLLDLDELKEINDEHGHLAGNRALCRLALALRAHCRAIDTPARCGGDEFVLIVPEADMEAALAIGRRICEWLSSDGEEPSISVSFGAAVCPEDGTLPDLLLRAADKQLYLMKRGAPPPSAKQPLPNR
jgi:diguanylate cyclase (GGDEF)-like protein